MLSGALTLGRIFTVMLMLLRLEPDVALADTTQCSSPPSVNQSVTGTLLYCYTCKETYKYTYDPYNSPCINNISAVDIAQCTGSDMFCYIERIDITGYQQVLNIQRGCTNLCLHGCRYNGFGLTYRKCTTCCRTYGCNSSHGTAPMVAPSSHLIILITLFGITYIHHTFYLSCK